MWKINKILIVLSFACHASVAQEQDFERLFTTAEMRQNLDLVRSLNKNALAVVSEREENKAPGLEYKKEAQSEQMQAVSLSGYVKREDGQSLIWLDGKSSLSEQSDANVAARPYRLKNHLLRVRAQGKSKILAPGQTWYIENDQVKEVFQKPPEISVAEPPELASQSDEKQK